MPTIISTPLAADANSYLEVAEADAYFTGHLYAGAWTAAAQATKETALIMATRLLDDMWEWSGSRKTATQALEWPRVGMIAKNKLQSVPDTVVPVEIKEATSELALALIGANLTANSDIETMKITSITAGPVSLSFGEGVVAKVIPDAVYFVIPPWWGWVKGRKRGVVQLQRG